MVELTSGKGGTTLFSAQKCRISYSYAEEEPEAVWYGGATDGMGWGLGGIASRETAPTPGLVP